MKKTTKTAGQTAQAQATQAQATQGAKVETAPQVENATKAEVKKARTALYKEVEARANMVAEAIREERASLSAVLRDMYECATEGGNYSANVREALRKDIKAITGAEVSTYANAREFARVWLDIVRKYATAQDDKTGNAVALHAVAGMVEAVAFRPTIKAVYFDIVRNWVRNLAPMKMRAGVWYTRKGRALAVVPKAEAVRLLAEYEERKEVAREGAKIGRAEALRKFEGAKAIAEA